MIRLYFINFLIFFFLFITSISQAKIITLKDCRYSWDDTFQKDLYEENKIVINTDNKTIIHYIILTDKNIKDNRQSNKALKQSNPQIPVYFPTNKMNKFEYKITSVQEDNVKNKFEILKGENKKSKINIILKEKKIEQEINSPITHNKITNIIYCN